METRCMSFLSSPQHSASAEARGAISRMLLSDVIPHGEHTFHVTGGFPSGRCIQNLNVIQVEM
jgi:hypothetical protein